MVSIRSFVSGSHYQIAVEAQHPHFVLVGQDTLDFFMIHTMIINRLLNQCLLETVQDHLSMSYLTLSFPLLLLPPLLAQSDFLGKKRIFGKINCRYGLWLGVSGARRLAARPVVRYFILNIHFCLFLTHLLLWGKIGASHERGCTLASQKASKIRW